MISVSSSRKRSNLQFRLSITTSREKLINASYSQISELLVMHWPFVEMDKEHGTQRAVAPPEICCPIKKVHHVRNKFRDIDRNPSISQRRVSFANGVAETRSKVRHADPITRKNRPANIREVYI